MIYESIFKGLHSVTLESDYIKVEVIPELGGKIASYYHKNEDFQLAFQNTEQEYRIPELYSEFEKFDASGFDDAFPNIDECIIEIEGKKIKYPDHGEVWASKMEYFIEDDKLKMSFESKILPYIYEKVIYLYKKGIKIEYNIENTGKFDFPCLWTAHYLINCHEEMELNFPEGTSEVINVKESTKLGKVGNIHPYPLTMDRNNVVYRLDRVMSMDEKKCEKYYVMDKIERGKCSVYYNHKDLKYTMKYDEDLLPYMGFWVTEGGFRGDYNCALEPCNGFYDSIHIAEKYGKVYTLKKNESLEFDIYISLK